MNRRDFLKSAAGVAVAAGISGHITGFSGQSLQVIESVTTTEMAPQWKAVTANFIPELWSQEVLNSYKQNLVMSSPLRG